jgi:hypothetical protein
MSIEKYIEGVPRSNRRRSQETNKMSCSSRKRGVLHTKEDEEERLKQERIAREMANVPYAELAPPLSLYERFKSLFFNVHKAQQVV